MEGVGEEGEGGEGGEGSGDDLEKWLVLSSVNI